MRALSAWRAVLGAAEVTFPGPAARAIVGLRLDSRARRVVRILGAREVVQAALSAARPVQAVMMVGVGVDFVHAASMLSLGVIDRPRRRACWTSAAIALGFASGGVVTIRSRRKQAQRG